MRKFGKIAALFLAGTMMMGISACGKEEIHSPPEPSGGGPQQQQPGKPGENKPSEKTEGRSELLVQAASAEGIPRQVRQNEEYLALKAAAESFAAQFASKVAEKVSGGNMVVSPISVYMALALATECVSERVRSELENVLNADYKLICSQIGNLYCGLTEETYDEQGTLVSKLALSNSVWLQKELQTKRECLETLSENYYCSSYSADFKNDNKAANAAIREFVKERTNGLIDEEFKFGDDTFFLLLNSLYVKDVWNILGSELEFTEESYAFRQGDGSEQPVRLMKSAYLKGRAVESEDWTHFYTKTLNGYKLKFLMPNPGHSAEEIFTAENIARINLIEDYGAEKDGVEYFTQCLFPQFQADFSEEINDILRDMGLNAFFNEPCSALTDENVSLRSLLHIAKLKVEARGIEGAAVTVLSAEGSSRPPLKEVYEDFVVDGAFGFILTDPYDTTLFSGIINQIDR